VRREANFFNGDELTLVYIAKRLKEALALEDLLTERAIDYYVEPDTYTGGVIFRRTRVGAFFYVRASDVDRTRAAMESGGYKSYLPEGEARGSEPT